MKIKVVVFLIFLLSINKSNAQRFEWIYKFPSVAPSIAMSKSDANVWEFGVFETGIFYQKKVGFSVGYSLSQSFIDEDVHQVWFNELMPGWNEYFAQAQPMYYVSKGAHLRISYRVMDRYGICFEPNLELGIISQGGDVMEAASLYQQKVPEMPGWYRGAWIRADAFRKLNLGFGLHAEAKIKTLNLFCNAMINRTPRWRLESRVQIEDMVAFDQHTIGKGPLLQFEMGLRMRIEKPFSFIRIK